MLLDILTDIEIEIGKAGTPGNEAARIYRINKAAEELHDASDFEEAMDEAIFNFNPTTEGAQTITLPPYIFKVRGARYADGRCPISIDDIRNRYNFQWYCENETWYLKPRYKGQSPLARDINNQSTVTLTVPIEEPSEFTVVITGTTDRANRVSETITFTTTDLEKESVGNYTKIESIVKSRITQSDVTILDAEENELGRILNSEYQSQYTLYQIMDEESGTTLPSNFSGTEILYKKKFQPFKNPQDTFFGTSRYDKAIFWKFMEHRVKDVKEAKAFQVKCQQVLSQMYENDSAGKRKKINFRPSPFYQMPYLYGKFGETFYNR